MLWKDRATWLSSATVMSKQKKHRWRPKICFSFLLSSCFFSSRLFPFWLHVSRRVHPQPWEPELEREIPPELWPIISCPHSRWLDSCRPRPVVSMGRAQEATAAKRQQQQYTERARYTEDSSITCRSKPRWRWMIKPTQFHVEPFLFCTDVYDSKALPAQQKEWWARQLWPFHCLFPNLKLWLLWGKPAENTEKNAVLFLFAQLRICPIFIWHKTNQRSSLSGFITSGV